MSEIEMELMAELDPVIYDKNIDTILQRLIPHRVSEDGVTEADDGG